MGFKKPAVNVLAVLTYMYLPVEAIAKYHAQTFVGRYKFCVLKIFHIILPFIYLFIYRICFSGQTCEASIFDTRDGCFQTIEGL